MQLGAVRFNGKIFTVCPKRLTIFMVLALWITLHHISLMFILLAGGLIPINTGNAPTPNIGLTESKNEKEITKTLPLWPIPALFRVKNKESEYLLMGAVCFPPEYSQNFFQAY